MNLKFTFNGAPSAPDGEARELPFSMSSPSGPAVSHSSVLELRVSRDSTQGDAAPLVGEALSGDGVSYARVERELGDATPLSVAVRSVLARLGAEMPEPLLGSVTAIVLALGGGEAEVLRELGIPVNLDEDPQASITEDLQARTGVSAGTAIRFE